MLSKDKKGQPKNRVFLFLCSFKPLLLGPQFRIYIWTGGGGNRQAGTIGKLVNSIHLGHSEAEARGK